MEPPRSDCLNIVDREVNAWESLADALRNLDDVNIIVKEQRENEFNLAAAEVDAAVTHHEIESERYMVHGG